MTTKAESDSGSPDRQIRRALLHLDGWAGRTTQPVLVIGETRTRYRIGCEQTTRLAGRRRNIEAGETVLVPKCAITFTEAQAPNRSSDKKDC
jgi:hypothetical protein